MCRLKKFKQLIKHDPGNDKWGDCARACIGCLLEIEPAKIPHFFDKDAENAYEEMDDWLSRKGISRIAIPLEACELEDALLWGARHFSGFEYLLLGTSRNDCNHVVICKGNEIVHDCALDDSGIIGPADDGRFWVEILCGKIGDEG